MAICLLSEKSSSYQKQTYSEININLTARTKLQVLRILSFSLARKKTNTVFLCPHKFLPSVQVGRDRLTGASECILPKHSV